MSCSGSSEWTRETFQMQNWQNLLTNWLESLGKEALKKILISLPQEIKGIKEDKLV